jgi:choline-sulfatase
MMPPDVVLIMTDQQRHDQLGYSSGGFFETPNLDRLAASGVTFDNAYSTSTTCVPARVGLLTGLLHHRVPTQVNRFALREGFWTIARELQAIGYETAVFGKMHSFPVHAEHGFETMQLVEHLKQARVDAGEVDDYHVWLSAQGLVDPRLEFGADEPKAGAAFPHDSASHPTGWIEQQVRSFLRSRDPRRPLFLVVSFPHPHAPHDPPEPYASMYDPDDVPLPKRGIEVNDALPPQFANAFSRFGNRRPRRVGDAEPEAFRRLVTKIRALVRHIDDSVGAIVDDLDMGRTLVFFTSDHGDYAGNRGVLGKAPWIPFEDLARVPFVVAGQGVSGGRHVGDLVQSYDFVPTVLDYIERDPRVRELDAVSLRPVLADPATPPDAGRAAFCATTMGWPMVRRGPYKYIWHRGTWSNVLFQLDDDPDETRNLSEDPACRDEWEELSHLLDGALEREMPHWESATS